jgi:ketosteroid isomerase-like protein
MRLADKVPPIARDFGSAAKLLAAIGIGLSSLTGAVARAAPVTVGARDEAAIRALENRLIEANRSKDTAAAMRLYASDTNVVIFDVVPPRQFLSKGNWEKNVDGYFALFDGPAGLEITDLSITVDGNLAYAHMIQHFFGKTKEGGSVDLSARVTDVYRKIAGRWFIVHEHVSVPVNLETGKADLHSKP